MHRVVIGLAFLLAACNMERETPVPPPPPPSATTATAPAPSTAPATTVPPQAAPPSATAAPPHAGTPPHTSVPTTAGAHAGTECEAAFRCCEATAAAMPIGGLVAGCGHLRQPDPSLDCARAIAGYRATLERVGVPIPAACRAHGHGSE